MWGFITKLPQESWTQTELRDEQPDSELVNDTPTGDVKHGPWSRVELLLASLIDEARSSRWVYTARHSKTQPPQPELVPRPGVKHRSNVRAINPAAAEYLDRLRATG